MEPITGVIIKPVSNGCNLHCSYCYARKGTLSPVRQMAVELGQRIVSAFLSQAGDGPVEFIWHGGEPLLRGLSFYEQIFDYQHQIAPSNRPFRNALQTNITLLDDSWIQFCCKHSLQLSTSLDGPPRIHNAGRHYASGSGSYDAVVTHLKAAQDAGVQVNVLAVITEESAAFPEEIYYHFKELEIGHVGFLPCFATDTSGATIPPTPTPGKYSQFLNRVFDLYMKDIEAPEVREFEQAVTILSNGTPDICNYSGACHHFVCVDWNGDVFACDTSPASSEFRFGNIVTQELSEILQSSTRASAVERTNAVTPECAKCKYWEGCHGGCPNQRVNSHYYFCQDRIAHFSHIENSLRRLCRSTVHQ